MSPNADPCWFVNHWQMVAAKIPRCGYPLEMHKVFVHMYFSPSLMCSIQTKVQMFNLFFFFDISNMWIPHPCAATSGSCQGQTVGRDMRLIICSQTAVWLNINNIHAKRNSAIQGHVRSVKSYLHKHGLILITFPWYVHILFRPSIPVVFLSEIFWLLFHVLSHVCSVTLISYLVQRDNQSWIFKSQI